ncbi:unnamed protein product [Clavelina lepadiformis]|uniref:Short-chain collagen C4-like n=1 Tax=Clavelina lepadiformis TaxID=159417 RepID=A0ABP0G8H8_CLALP
MPLYELKSRGDGYHGKRNRDIVALNETHLKFFLKRGIFLALLLLLCSASYYFGASSSKDGRDIAMLTRSKRGVHDHAGSDHHVIKRAADDENQGEFTRTGGGVTYVTSDGAAGIAPTRHGRRWCTKGKYIDGNQGGTFLYGVEYREGAWADHLFNLSLIEGTNLRLHDVPCALCMAGSRYTQLMIPGRRTCPDGWTREYTGIIMTSYQSHAHSSPHLCIDDTPQVVPGSEAEQNGELLYVVEAQCPSLQCEPVVQGREVVCVVCTL